MQDNRIGLLVFIASLLGVMSMYGFVSLIKPLNLSVFVVIWVFAPWLFAGLLHRFQPQLAGFLPRLNSIKLRWQYWRWAVALASLSYSAGALVCLLLTFLLVDLPFYWSTSIQAFDTWLLSLFHALDWLWQGWLPMAVFDEAWFVQAKNASSASSFDGLSAIWPYVLMLLIFYSLLPRVVIVAWLTYKQWKARKFEVEMVFAAADAPLVATPTPLALAPLQPIDSRRWKEYSHLGWQLPDDQGVRMNLGFQPWQKDIEAIAAIDLSQSLLHVHAGQAPTAEIIDLINHGAGSLCALVIIQQECASKGQITSWLNFAQTHNLAICSPPNKRSGDEI